MNGGDLLMNTAVTPASASTHKRASYNGPRCSQIFSNGRNFGDLLEDIYISDSDDSGIDGTSFDDDDEDWVESGKLQVKKRGSKTGSNGIEKTASDDAGNVESLNSDISSDEEAINKNLTPSSEACCTCTKFSSCKTNKCQCRASGSLCRFSCGCMPTKCSNRDNNNVIKKDKEDPRQTEMTEGDGITSIDSLGNDNAKNSKMLASHGAMLLQSALSGRPIEAKEDDAQQRRPLSDIGNTMTQPNVPKLKQRKQWQRSEIQLIPAAAPPAQSESKEAPRLTGNSMEAEVPTKIPRPMNTTTLTSNPLRERNSNSTSEFASEKDGGHNARRSPIRQPRDLNEKENNRM